MNNQFTFYESQKEFNKYINAYYYMFKHFFKGRTDLKLLHIIGDYFYTTNTGNIKLSYLHQFQLSIEKALNKGYDLLDSLPIVFIEEYK